MNDTIKYISGIPDSVILIYFNYNESILTNNELTISNFNYEPKLIYLFLMNSFPRYYRIQSIFGYFFKHILNYNISYNIPICFTKYKNIIIPQNNIVNDLLKNIFKIDTQDEKYYFYICHKNMLIYLTTDEFIIKKIRYNLKILLLNINKLHVHNINDLIYNLYVIIIKSYNNNKIRINRFILE